MCNVYWKWQKAAQKPGAPEIDFCVQMTLNCCAYIHNEKNASMAETKILFGNNRGSE